jgi:hypothetical protein
MNSSTIRQKLFVLIQKQTTLEHLLARSRDKMVKGSLFQWYTACRKGNCKCTRGQKHGPFLYAAVGVRGKTIQRYVGKEEDIGLVQRLKNYREFKKKRLELHQLNRTLEQQWKLLEKNLMEGRLR